MSESMQSVVWRAAPLSQFFTEIFRNKILLGVKECDVKEGGGGKFSSEAIVFPVALLSKNF
jgi:hypothetical protein